jgi:hypothetical protein
MSTITRMFHESPAATTDMGVLPDVLGCGSLRRTIQVRLETNPAVPRDELSGGTPILFALAALRSVPQAGSQFHGLATAIQETSGLEKPGVRSSVGKEQRVKDFRFSLCAMPHAPCLLFLTPEFLH